MPTRRGFLNWIVGGAAASAALGAHAMGIDTSPDAGDRTAFNFTCACGEGMCAEVPKEVGEKITFDCKCGTSWELEWTGKNFKTKMQNPNGANAAAYDFAEDCRIAAEKLRGEPVEASGAYIPDEDVPEIHNDALGG